MSQVTRSRTTNRETRIASRALAACVGAAATLCGAHAGADFDRGEWFGSPVSGTIYRVERDAATREKHLVAPDGRSFPSTAAIVEAETAALTPLARLLDPELLAMAGDPARADELVGVTFIFRDQPLHDAGVAARARANPALEAALTSEHRILDRIAPLRTLPGGRAPDVATAMRDEAALLTDEEKQTLREASDTIRSTLATMRREILDEATPAVELDQAPLAEYLRAIPEALDFGGSVTLNARSARVPARVLGEIAERFPEVMRVERMKSGEGCMDTAAQTVGAGSWHTAGYNGTSGEKICLIDSGVDSSHPALSNVVVGSTVVHTAASSYSDYGDNASSSDDLQGHGTNAAGILCSNDSTYTGIAPGAHILNAKAAYYGNVDLASHMVFSDGRAAGDWAFNQGATSALITFGGSGTNAGTDEMALFFDAAASSLGIPGVIAAKNYGPSSGSLGYPGCAFNVITCGNFDDNGTTSHSDDSLYTTSGRGPTSDGRQKPDLCAPGVNITTTAHNWEGSNPDFVTVSPGTTTGTSVVGPIIAGAYCLLQDYGAATTPQGLKALLVATANNQSPYAGPDSNWGYGSLDCAGAYTYRGSVYEGQLTSTGPRYVLLRGGSVASGGRATLVWNRQVTSAGSNTPTTYYGIQDLDLYVFDESSGSQVGSSTSTVDPNEQAVLSSAVTSPIYKVYRAASSFTSSYSTEPFAVAAESTSSTALVSPPTLTCTFSQLATAVAGSADTTVIVQVANTGGAAAVAPSVTLTVPSGYTITSGANPQTLSNVAGQSTGSATWTVHSPSGPSGTGTFSAGATSTCYGDTFTSATLTGSQTLDVDAPTATVAISGGAPYGTGGTVTVTLTASDSGTGVAQMRVRNAGDAWGAWTAYATSVSTTLSSGDGTKTFEAEFADGVGNVAAASDSIIVDATPPSGSVVIEGGAAYANSSSVTLTTTATDATSGVAETRYSLDNVNWGSWFTYAPTASWTFPEGEGTKTVYAQYRDGAGNLSAVVSDSIVVDTGPPAGTITIAGGAAWTTTRDVTLNLSATDAGSGVHDMRFSNVGAPFSAWRAYAATASWTLPPTDGPTTVYAQFRDAAGNVSDSVSDAINVDATPPAGAVTISNGASFSTTASVTLGVFASDNLNGVAQMRFSNDDSNWTAWTSYGTSVNWTLAAGDGTRTVYAQFTDGLGNASASITDTIIVDTTPPTGSVAILGDAAAINTPEVSLDLTWSDGGSGVSSVRLSNDGANWSAWTPAAASVPWTMQTGDGPHTVQVQFRDGAGNVSENASDSIVIDTVAPTGTFVLAGDAAYVMPWETLAADTTASDGPTGSGVAALRTSADAGATWTAWTPIGEDGRVIVPRPAGGSDKPVTIQGEIRDVAGNVSAAGVDATYLVDAAAPSVTAIKSFTGTVGLDDDRDAVRMGLLAGDKLTLKLKVKTLVKKADAHVDIDIWGPDHTRLVEGHYPPTSKSSGVTKFAAPATGEYWIVLRSAGTAAGTGVAYTMSVADAAAKGTRALKGTAAIDATASPSAATLQFDAAGELTLAGTLSGALTPATTPTLVGPDGSAVPLAVLPAPKGAVKLVPVQLGGGTGTYKLTIPATGPVAYKLALSVVKPGKLDELTMSGN
jgi:hypothetical protein